VKFFSKFRFLALHPCRFLTLNNEIHSFTLFAELNVDEARLTAACGALNDSRALLAQVNFDSGYLDDIADVAQAARQLLSLFPPNEGLSTLSLLEAQFQSHKYFKNNRMAAHCWRFEFSDASAEIDYQAAIVILRGIVDNFEVYSTVAAMGALHSAVKACDECALQEALNHLDELQVNSDVFFH
jgi:hypothetical protein